MVTPNVGLQVTIILTEAEVRIVRWIAESSNKLPEDIVYQFYLIRC
jgi:DNA-binding CsgD family transcriptional regulator